MRQPVSFFPQHGLIVALAVIALPTGIGMAAAMTTRLTTGEQTVWAWGIVGLVLFLARIWKRKQEYFSLVLSLVVILMLGRYLFFRLSSTLTGATLIELFFVLLLFFAELYGMTIQILGIIVNVRPLHRPVEPIDLHDPDLPMVDVLIPTYNEPALMVAITAGACTLFDYPRDKVTIFILDDGGTWQKCNDSDPRRAKAATNRREILQTLARFLGVNYLTRRHNVSAKAGNINAALYETDDGQVHPTGDLVVILDCDHVPTRDFLRNTVGYFQKDPKLFLVQTPHFFINPDPVEKNLGTFDKMPGDNVMFYGKVMPGLDLWNGAFFCGSAAVLRRSCLDEVGGVVGETITEDAETSLTLHDRGYNSAYLGCPMVCGLSPETFGDFIIQRNRWAQGMVQILILKNPLLRRGMKMIQRICYLNSASFWFFSLSRLMFMLAPFFFLYGNIQIYHATLAQCLAYPIPYMALSLILTNFMYGHVRYPFFSELYEVVLSFYNIPAIISVLRRPRSPRFQVTPKDASLQHDRLSPLAWPFYVLMILFAGMYPVALHRLANNPQLAGAIAICLAWGTFNLIILLLCLGVVWEKRQIRRKYRVPVREPVRIRRCGREGEPGPWIAATSRDLSEEGMGVEIADTSSLGRGDRIQIAARTPSGRGFLFDATVVHLHRHDGKLVLGCEYLFEDEDSFLNITNYLYGESERWLHLWRKRQKRVSLVRGLLTILKLGLTGSFHHLRGLSWLAGKKMTKLLIHTANRCLDRSACPRSG